MRDFERRPGRISVLPLGARVLYSIYLAFALVALAVAALLGQLGPGYAPDGVADYYAGSQQVLPTPATPQASGGPSITLPGAAGPVVTVSGSGGPSITLPGAGGPSITLPDTAGPTIALPPGDLSEADAAPSRARIVVAMSRRRMLEVTHGHLFVMPLFYLVIAHLFVLVGLRPPVTVALLLGGATGIALHIAAPWLVVLASRDLAWLMPVSGILMLVSLGAMALVTLFAMWRPARSVAAST